MPNESSVPEPAVTVTELACIRGGRSVFEGLSFAVAQGTSVRIAGANGTGKTTLLRILAGLLRPSAGEVSCQWDDVAYAGHAVPVKSRLTVTENITYWLDVHGQTYDPTVLAVLDLDSCADRVAETLSEGQRRRLALTSVLATGRRLWLLDEPMMSLDTGSQAQLADAIRSHCKAGGTALYTSPGQDALPADQIIHMESP